VISEVLTINGKIAEMYGFVVKWSFLIKDGFCDKHRINDNVEECEKAVMR